MVIMRKEGDNVYVEDNTDYSVIDLELYKCKLVNSEWEKLEDSEYKLVKFKHVEDWDDPPPLEFLNKNPEITDFKDGDTAWCYFYYVYDEEEEEEIEKIQPINPNNISDNPDEFSDMTHGINGF